MSEEETEKSKQGMNKFMTNLLSVSVEKKDTTIAIREWVKVETEKRTEMDRQCICHHRIKNVTYFYNNRTKKTIICGTTCSMKINMDKNEEMKDDMMKRALVHVFKKYRNKEGGGYKTIESMDEYVEEVKEHLINNILSQYEDIKNCYDHIMHKDFTSSIIIKIRERMIKLENKVEETITDHGIDYLGTILNMIKLTLVEMTKKIKETHEKEVRDELRIQELEKQRMEEHMKMMRHAELMRIERVQRDTEIILMEKEDTRTVFREKEECNRKKEMYQMGCEDERKRTREKERIAQFWKERQEIELRKIAWINQVHQKKEEQDNAQREKDRENYLRETEKKEKNKEIYDQIGKHNFMLNTKNDELSVVRNKIQQISKKKSKKENQTLLNVTKTNMTKKENELEKEIAEINMMIGRLRKGLV